VGSTRIIWLAALAALLAIANAITACGGDGEQAAKPVTADLRVVLTLTGPNAAFGLSSEASIELALAECWWPGWAACCHGFRHVVQ
jgi:hypothetical protein